MARNLGPLVFFVNLRQAIEALVEPEANGAQSRRVPRTFAKVRPPDERLVMRSHAAEIDVFTRRDRCDRHADAEVAEIAELLGPHDAGAEQDASKDASKIAWQDGRHFPIVVSSRGEPAASSFLWMSQARAPSPKKSVQS